MPSLQCENIKRVNVTETYITVVSLSIPSGTKAVAIQETPASSVKAKKSHLRPILSISTMVRAVDGISTQAEMKKFRYGSPARLLVLILSP